MAAPFGRPCPLYDAVIHRHGIVDPACAQRRDALRTVSRSHTMIGSRTPSAFVLLLSLSLSLSCSQAHPIAGINSASHSFPLPSSATMSGTAPPLHAPLRCHVSSARLFACPAASYTPGYANLTHYRVQCLEDFIALHVLRFTLERPTQALLLQRYSNVTTGLTTMASNAFVSIDYPRLVGDFLGPYQPSSQVPLGYYEWLSADIRLPLTGPCQVRGVFYLVNQDGLRVACLGYAFVYGEVRVESSSSSGYASTGGDGEAGGLSYNVEVAVTLVLTVVFCLPLVLILVGLWRRQRRRASALLRPVAELLHAELDEVLLQNERSALDLFAVAEEKE